MGFKAIIVCFAFIGYAHSQTRYNICVPSTEPLLCMNLERDGSPVACRDMPTRIDCAMALARGTAHAGYFSEEELLLLGQRQLNLRVAATVRNADKPTQYAFEGVVVVPNSHSGGFEGLRGGRYCHPGFGATDIRWSPRVLRTLESLATRNERCPSKITERSAEDLEVEILSNFFEAACRPGPWSYNSTVDAALKSRYPNLCSMCTADGVCTGYNTSNAVAIAGISNSNSHIQALDCLIRNGTVAFAAWTYVQQFFQTRNPEAANLYSLLCEDGARTPLSPEILTSAESPCSVVKQPWGAIVTNADVADNFLASLRTWWPDGINTGTAVWQTSLYNVLAPDSNARIFYLNATTLPSNFTSSIRVIPSIDAVSSCIPANRWCTISVQEQEKCSWVRSAAYSLGIQPSISCQQRADVFECLRDVREDRADFIALDSHYGYLARRHYQLSPVKLVQNNHMSSSRVAVMIKETSTSNISRFENLRDKVACFPEFGGIAYVAFVRIAQQLDVISRTECNYAKAVGEFFSGACAPGALDEAHAISDDKTFNTTNLCTACRPRELLAPMVTPDFTCAWDYNNMYYGNNGSLLCLTDPNTDVAVLEMQNLASHFQSLNLPPAAYRALCANNTLASTPGIDIPDDCLIANVVDSEVLTRRNSPVTNSLSSLLDGLEEFFGYSIAPLRQLINLHLYSPFEGTPDLLFKDSTIGLTPPSLDNIDLAAKNYIELFSHLEGCANDASSPGRAGRMVVSFIGLAVSALLARYVMN